MNKKWTLRFLLVVGIIGAVAAIIGMATLAQGVSASTSEIEATPVATPEANATFVPSEATPLVLNGMQGVGAITTVDRGQYGNIIGTYLFYFNEVQIEGASLNINGLFSDPAGTGRVKAFSLFIQNGGAGTIMLPFGKDNTMRFGTADSCGVEVKLPSRDGIMRTEPLNDANCSSWPQMKGETVWNFAGTWGGLLVTGQFSY